jgi:peptidyl-prolyl cis-trans isomerase C
METPDGQQFNEETQARPVAAAARAMASSAMMFLRALGKIALTTWRLAAALDSALWRATKLFGRRALAGLAYTARLAGAAFRGFVLWLPTRTGRAYSAMSGAFLVIAGLWIIDVLRATPSLDTDASVLRPPVDEDDPILARIEGRYVHLSEIEAAARAGGFLHPGEALTPRSAFERNLVASYVEQRLLARAALSDGLQRNPGVTRKVNAARDRVLASAYMDAQLQEKVTPDAVERLYSRQSDVTRLGDEVRARHIVVETGEEAAEIITLLEGGADFSALARERSIDRATAPLGGEVGWFTRAMMTPVFARAAFNTQPGEVAPAFQTEFGWHILEVLDRRSTDSVPFAQVKPAIEDFLRMRTIETSLRELEEKSQVVYFRPEPEMLTTSEPPDLRDPTFVESEEAEPEDTDSPEDGETPAVTTADRQDATR